MKTNLYKYLSMGIIALGLSFNLTSCKIGPVEPTNEIENKLHEDPSKVTIQLVECHLHADWKDIQKVGGPHQNPESSAKHLKRVQEITYILIKEKGWVVSPESQTKFYVQKNGEYKMGNAFTPAPVYLLFIHYYNAKNELMDNQFIENGQALIHQHFFTPTDVKPTFDGMAEEDDSFPDKMIDYIYADTTPWNQTKHEHHATITGKENPIGFKGVIRFLKDRKEFNLRIKLYHGYKSKINPITNTFDPFYKPSGVLIQNGTWDINIQIPILVLWNREDFVDIEEDQDVSLIPENSLDEQSNKTIHSIMNAFNISWTEALLELQSYTYKTKDLESGGIWL